MSRSAGRDATASSHTQRRRRHSGLCSLLGAALLLSTGLTSGAAAADAQSTQWALSAMKAEEMWKVSTGEGIKIAVIDTGVNPDTPALKGQVLADEVPESLAHKATEDDEGHGTTMAELIAGTGAGGGLKGLAPGAKVVPYRVAMKAETGPESRKFPDLADVIRAVADSDVKIINMSFGGEFHVPDIEKAITYAHSKGKLMITSAVTNPESKHAVGYPAAYPYVVGVAATDASGKVINRSEESNFVDVAAPGQDLASYCDTTRRSSCDGNGGIDGAAALTSASAALIWSAHPDWTANQVLGSIIDTAGRDWEKDDPSTFLGYGLVRPRRVLTNPDFKPGPADTDPLARENDRSMFDKSGKPAAESGKPAAEDSSDSSNTTLWVVLGGAAAALALGGGAFAVLRSRRSS
ncbi:S8 family serine peptidase [Streptomyces sp. H28]|uniref:S8 family serine peptidase n=1 Tax=Streptomyces sp. H28 TaxID=2775865 RepID=UPI001783F26D|nr:S8 family serine peptidase [Streptomyces sp. H28]